jgi:hypothetical protein
VAVDKDASPVEGVIDSNLSMPGWGALNIYTSPLESRVPLLYADGRARLEL